MAEDIKEPEIEKIDLLDSQYPLLLNFRKKCPGTYKHSQTIVSIIEAVAMELGLDINSMKIRGMYHDIGKIMNPMYFSENQGEDNLHDSINPYSSFQIITRHVSDSIMILLNDQNFPRDIIESISRHHGTSLMKHFYLKTKKAGEEIDESVYRYSTPKPQTIEDAILMITDCAEASTRSMSQNGKLENVCGHVEAIINSLMNDGQLDEVTMKFGDLRKVKEVLITELGGLYQKRVEYEEEKKMREK